MTRKFSRTNDTKFTPDFTSIEICAVLRKTKRFSSWSVKIEKRSTWIYWCKKVLHTFPSIQLFFRSIKWQPRDSSHKGHILYVSGGLSHTSRLKVIIKKTTAISLSSLDTISVQRRKSVSFFLKKTPQGSFHELFYTDLVDVKQEAESTTETDVMWDKQQWRSVVEAYK